MGHAYTPEDAVRKDTYNAVMWRKWPWIVHLLLTGGWVAYLFADGHLAPDDPGTIAGVVVASGLAVLLVLWPVMWCYVRIRYRA